MTTCSICQQQIPVDELQEHMRIELLDPRWKSQRDQLEARRAQLSELQKGANIEQSLKRLARARTDIFGTEEDEEKRKQEEALEQERRREREKVVWDGHTASKEKTMDKFSMQQNFDEQIAQIHRAKGLGPYVQFLLVYMINMHNLTCPLQNVGWIPPPPALLLAHLQDLVLPHPYLLPLPPCQPTPTRTAQEPTSAAPRSPSPRSPRPWACPCTAGCPHRPAGPRPSCSRRCTTPAWTPRSRSHTSRPWALGAGRVLLASLRWACTPRGWLHSQLEVGARRRPRRKQAWCARRTR